MKKFTFLAMSCMLSFFGSNVYAQDDFTQGTDYHVIYLDQESFSKIPAASLAHDYRTDDVNHFLFVWDGTYNSLAPSGPNWNGEVGEFLSFEVKAGPGWSGFGFACPPAPSTAMKDMTKVTADFTLHVAMKSGNAATHCIKLEGPGGLAGFAAIGAADFADNGNVYKPYTNFARDNKWHLVEIPMSYFFTQGLRYPEAMRENVFAMLSGGVGGTPIALDAIFIYNKNTSGIGSTSNDNVLVDVKDEYITVVGTNSPIELFNLQGAKVKASAEAIIDIQGLSKGAYILKSGNFTQKVILK